MAPVSFLQTVVTKSPTVHVTEASPDLEELPFATLRDRCNHMEVITGLSVSRSAMCRAIARIVPTKKKGDE